MVCYYYPFCQNQFAEHQQHMTTLQNYSGILWHDAFVPHGTGLHGCAIQPWENHLSVGCNELLHALILLYMLFLHNLNTSKACSIIGSGHLIVFAQEVENRGTENVRDVWKERGESSKQGFRLTTPTFAVNVLIRGCGACGGLAFHHLVCWNLCVVFQ